MLTFHKIITGCEAGREENWRAFIEDYTPVVLSLARIYMPGLADPRRFWRESLADLCGGDFKTLRSFSHQSEREFLLELRAFLFARGRAALDPSKDFADFPQPTVEGIGELVHGLPLHHQEVLFLKLAGYSDSTLEQIYRIAPGVAAKSLERLQGDYAAALEKTADECLLPHAWLKLQGELRAARKESCPAIRLLVRVLDGQAGWNDKEPVERHLAECLPCLECWTALREISYWRQAAKAVPGDVVDGLLAALPVAKQAAKPKSLIQRIWGVS